MLSLLLQPWVEPLSWQRDSIIYGHQYWRLLTGVFVHANLPHYLMNSAALMLIALLFGQRLSLKHWAIISLLITLIANSLLLLQHQTYDYVGLSGLLHALVLYAAMMSLSQAKLESILILAALGIKLILEWYFPNGLGDQQFIAVPVATVVHRYFSLTALISALFYLGLDRARLKVIKQ